MSDNILFINACARPESRTLELANHFLSKCNGEITRLNLFDENLSPLDFEGLKKRESIILANGGPDNFPYAKQFCDADIIVIAAPFWDLSFPSVLKIYLESVSVLGVTFRYSKKGVAQGLCRARELYYITTAGGYIGNNNLGFSYVKALAENFYGIKNVHFRSAEGLDIFGADTDAIMNEAKKSLE